ncbi:MAG: plastocyanin/azurin family copper-binding protein [Thermoanaerobaculia bacterium]
MNPKVGFRAAASRAPRFFAALALLLSAATTLSAAPAAPAPAAAKPAAAPATGPRVIKLKGLETMQYDIKIIQAKPGEALKVVLTGVGSMPKSDMAHNFTLLAKGTNEDAFVMDAAMAKDNGYMPKAKASSVLASTKLAGGGETVEVVFNAPKEPGEYTYLCTFPAHSMSGMKGKLVVK